jgi:hypothetical protein
MHYANDFMMFLVLRLYLVVLLERSEGRGSRKERQDSVRLSQCRIPAC